MMNKNTIDEAKIKSPIEKGDAKIAWEIGISTANYLSGYENFKRHMARAVKLVETFIASGVWERMKYEGKKREWGMDFAFFEKANWSKDMEDFNKVRKVAELVWMIKEFNRIFE